MQREERGALVWAESAGGPLALVERQALDDWTGYEGDYERACAVETVDVIPFGGGARALILWEEPAATAFLPEVRTFVQWLYADPGTDAARAVRDTAGVAWEAGPVFETAGPLVLLDAAIPGADIEIDRPAHGDSGAEAISVDLPPGRYHVESGDVKPDERSCFRLYRLVLLNEA
ncbi:Imm21 family immunity protein [Streptosporangium sandarakinum]|uniref:Imm21 family immunity protein n=1 Tax=Streptosporangium sandarakinum TaxID=1260955 RepID=UPI0036977278